MPENKAAVIRYGMIDQCLRNTMRKWTKKTLLDEVNKKLKSHYEIHGISLSMIRNDIAAMQSIYGAPIMFKKEGKEVYYYYEDPSFSIQNIPVSEEDILRLNEAVHLLKQINGFTLSEGIEEVLVKLERKVKMHSVKRSVICFENAPAIKGIELLEDIYTAILQKKVLRIAYQSFTQDQPQEWLIHPYLIKEYNNRWFLFGLHHITGSIGIYPLDRMHSVKVTSEVYIKNTTLSPDDYFKNIIGVTIPPNGIIERVVLEFSAARAPYVLTKPIHHSQRTVEIKEDRKVIIEIAVIPNPELESVIMSFGCDVTVKSPISLSEKIKQIAKKLVECYAGNI